jgi:2-oxoglutarate ferredoxin oxidoreductase subunit gamma
MIKEIRLSGSGGQGIILAGDILAEAAAIYEGRNATQNTAYGGQVRGGSSRSEILIGDADEEIEYPEVIKADILLSMNQEAANTYSQDIKEEGFFIVDSSYVTKVPETKVKIFQFPITDIARQTCKNILVANMVALGILIGLTHLVSVEAIEWAIEKKVPKGTAEINKLAFLVGLEQSQKK